MKLPGVYETKEYLVKAEDLWPGLEKAIRIALRSLVMMRAREGKALAADIGDKLKKMTARLKAIEQIIAVTHSDAFAEKAEHVIRVDKEADVSKVSVEK